MEIATTLENEKKYEDVIAVKYLDLNISEIKFALETRADNISEKEQRKYARSIELLAHIMSYSIKQTALINNGEYKEKKGSERFSTITSLMRADQLELIQLITQC